MAEEQEDPREVSWHPRFSKALVGHKSALQHFTTAFDRGTPHHAWLLAGPKGIGKSTFAYHLAKYVLGKSNPAQTDRWMASRSHPDLFILERGFTDTKPRRLRRDIVVDDARKLSEFFNRTSASGGWRVAIVDSADDLNTEAANALLKLVEEPPAKALILLVSHQPGSLLRTLKSRCLRLNMQPLLLAETQQVLASLPEDMQPNDPAIAMSAGSPGRALELENSVGAKAFAQFTTARDLSPASKSAIANNFSSRQAATEDYATFITLLLEWLAHQATREPATAKGAALAAAYQKLSETSRVTEGFNMDRRNAVLSTLNLVNDALKAA